MKTAGQVCIFLAFFWEGVCLIFFLIHFCVFFPSASPTYRNTKQNQRGKTLKSNLSIVPSPSSKIPNKQILFWHRFLFFTKRKLDGYKYQLFLRKVATLFFHHQHHRFPLISSKVSVIVSRENDHSDFFFNFFCPHHLDCSFAQMELFLN